MHLFPRRRNLHIISYRHSCIINLTPRRHRYSLGNTYIHFYDMIGYLWIQHIVVYIAFIYLFLHSHLGYHPSVIYIGVFGQGVRHT